MRINIMTVCFQSILVIMSYTITTDSTYPLMYSSLKNKSSLQKTINLAQISTYDNIIICTMNPSTKQLKDKLIKYYQLCKLFKA